MVFDASEAMSRFGESHTTVVLWQRFEVSHREMFDSLKSAIEFIRGNSFRPTRVELHLHRGGHDVLIAGDELAQLLQEHAGQKA
ncbi:hypothetical protein [Agrobacterium sp. SORGH_AS 787]|uniref:hypothetical protein n=1 Tax=Agrobacterium sp. SORGH_AS 787 TaxID=3041775 RepID=UPI002787BC6A|nr:hypothetical protein [Rhizobium sp. SORGH_AS_0787]